MAKFGPQNLKLELDDTVGGSLVDISDYVLETSGINVQAVTEEITPYSANWQEHGAVGIRFADQVTLGGITSDDANNPFNLCRGAENEVRTLKVTYDGSAGTVFDQVECIIVGCQRLAQRGAFQRYSITLQPTGAVTIA